MKRIFAFFSIIGILFLILPIINLILKPDGGDLLLALKDKEVIKSISLSLYCAVISCLICIIIGTPLAYIFARKDFLFKKTFEGIIDLPLMIPHPVIGIAILTVIAKDYWIGKILYSLSIQIVGSIKGIVIVMTYVAFPFYVNSLKAGIKQIPERLEYVSRTLGKGELETFFRITLPLSFKNMLEGIIMSIARAISEFGAVIIIAYHPMVAPVLIYDRFNTFGLKYSVSVAVLLIIICLMLFVFLRTISNKKN